MDQQSIQSYQREREANPLPIFSESDMRIGSMVRSGITDHTSGYGNTRTGVAMTEDYIADNEICEGRLIGGIPDPSQPNSILSRLWNVLDMNDPEREPAIERLRIEWMSPHENGSKGYYAAQARFSSMLTTLTYGKYKFRRVTRRCRKAS